ncbi:MAG TPA: APC family permease [Ktedonobacterales bacterium]
MSATRAPQSLRRVLRFRTIVSTSTGLAYAAISLLGCIQLAAYLAGDSAWIALLIAGLLALLAAFCFSELNALYPSAAAIRLYIRSAFNERASLIISFGYLVTVVAVIAADSYVVGSAVSCFSQQCYTHGTILQNPGPDTYIWILALLALATAANLLGIRIAGLVQDIATYALLISLAIISFIALSKSGFHLHQPTAALHSPVNLIQAVAVGVFVFSAFEWVTPLSEEMTDTRLIPRGMFVALGLLFLSYSLFTVASTNLVGIQHLCQNVGTDNVICSNVPQMLLGWQALGQTGALWMLLATLLTGVMTFNGGFAAASRFMYAAAREATLPPFFARLSYARVVPWAAVVSLAAASAVIAVVVALTQSFNALILVGAVLEAMIYAVAGLCVLVLRNRQSDTQRSFLIPLGPVIPVATIVIFSLLGVIAAVTLTPVRIGGAQVLLPVPLAITAAIFLLSFLYVQYYVPRLKAADEARRAARTPRRPRRQAAEETEPTAPLPEQE